MRHLTVSAVIVTGFASAQEVRVKTLRAPFDGHRPQAVMTSDGTLHVVQGSRLSRGDVFYTRRAKDSERFSEPIKVNSVDGVVAGFDMAVAPGGRVHVLMRTNPKYSSLKMPDKEKLRIFDLKYMLYARLADDGESFEEMRNLAGDTIAFEGMGAVTAESDDTIRAFWHGQKEEELDESKRRVYTSVSTDGGETFSAPTPIESDVTGACQCCAMDALVDSRGHIHLAFRNSKPFGEGMTKDSYHLVSDDGGKTYRSTLLEVWRNAGCPGSTCSLAEIGPSVSTTWSTRGKVRMAPVAQRDRRVEFGGRVPFRGQTVVGDPRGETLLVWSSVLPKSRGAGHVLWHIHDADGEPTGERGHVPMGTAAGWGSATAFVDTDGKFVIMYDGTGKPRKRD